MPDVSDPIRRKYRIASPSSYAAGRFLEKKSEHSEVFAPRNLRRFRSRNLWSGTRRRAAEETRGVDCARHGPASAI